MTSCGGVFPGPSVSYDDLNAVMHGPLDRIHTSKGIEMARHGFPNPFSSEVS